jgi:outer membrane protein assembly factor BamA
MTRTFCVKIFAAFIFISFFFTCYLAAQTGEQEPVKTGWTFGALPAVSYNSDLGLQYGGLVNLYYFGDGSSYPQYMHSIYAEISRYTKGSGVNRLFYDSGYLLPGLRVTADLSYFTEKALDFYGFNGFNSLYSLNFEDEDHPDYLSRMFYRHERNTFRFTLDFQGRLAGRSLRWIGGLGLMNTGIAPVDIASLNEGRDPEDMLPEDVPGLYERYMEWNMISEDEREGGNTHHLKLGVVYDTRDNEPNPMRGIWSEAVVFAVPGFMGNGNFSYSRISLTHRQYFTIIEKDLSFAYRLNYQGTLGGDVPFYMLPYMINSFSLSSNIDGLGGSKTVRGVLRNRIVGEGIASGNFELRWKFYRTVLFNQNIYLALNGFTDAGMVVTKREISGEGIPDGFYTPGEESLHISLGGGFRIAMNENFIIAVDYGKPLDNRDGGGGLYIGLNYLF